MIRHCVFVRLRPDLGEEERRGVFDGLAALRGRIDGIEAVRHGPNVSPEGLGRGYDYGFIMDFRDAAARDAYIVHPDHKAAGARLREACEGGRDGILVFDLEIG